MACLGFVTASLGLMAFDWPSQLSWFKPRQAEPTAASVQRSSDKVRNKTYQLKGWMMDIQKDGFTGQVRCHLFSMRTLSQGRITYAQNTLGFELDPGQSTLNAWYRIDNRPAQRANDLYPRLVAERVAGSEGSLENPTGGVVLIPAADLANARTVTIRVNEQAAPKRFNLKGFDGALKAARYNGCMSDDSFERYKW
jgi:hypothetical protein